MARDDFTEATKKLLAERVGYICSNPFCRRVTVGPQIGGEKTVNIGEAAHICAASPGGKRYDPEMTSDKRKSVDNGIWMCRTHATLIGRDEKYFTVEMLKKWKEDAEREAGNRLIGQETIKKCKFRMLIFYNDLVECKKAVQLLAMKRGVAVSGTLLPIQKTKGRRMADMNTVRYCGRYDIFMDRMQTYLTDELIETVKFYTELV